MKIRIVALLVGLAACDSAPVVEDAPKPVAVTPEAAKPPPPPAPPAAKPARRFIEVQGTVALDGAPAKVDQEISLTANITTGADGKAVVTIAPGSLIEIRPNSKLDFTKSTRKESSVKLALGAIWSFLPTGSSYEVETLNAVAGVRGTAFYVEASEKTTYVCACDGNVDVGNPKAKKLVSVPSKMEHKGFSFGAKAKKRVRRQGHTDEDKDRLIAMMPLTMPAEKAPAPSPAPAPAPAPAPK